MLRLLFRFLLILAAAGMISSSPSLFAQADYKRFYDEDKLPQVREIFLSGRYDIVIQICDYALQRGQPSWEWRTLRMKSLGRMGRYEESLEEAASIAKLFSDQLGALLVAHEFYSKMQRNEEADALFDAINDAATVLPSKDRDGLDLVHLGKAALILGADPATVLEQYYGPAKTQKAKGKTAPKGLIEAHQASGELALEKSDFKLAAKEFQAALKYEPDNPDLRFGLAKAFLPDDRKTGMAHLDRVLKNSEIHFDALLLQAEFAINFEQYENAEQYLNLVHSINPREPEAFAYRAIIANLRENDPKAFEAARAEALKVRPKDPEFDHLIGRVLSRNYRFAEGSNSQKRALKFDPDFLPAKLQLALDYLRLGELEKAWPLAKEVGEADSYNVLAYNLELLEKEIESFAALKSEHFIIRMPPNEADLYGDRVVEILNDARNVLEKKYGMKIDHPVLVEFYPNQQDFAIRSFGSLGGAGLLGVCFGSVVTMNSPGSPAHGKNNWEATLWHEYCHVITLTATKNKMPRWLSEGISVYEEMQKNPTWGQRMTPRYRDMILEEGDLTPVGELSQAFYTAEDGEHIMFAYFQSMLVVEYIVKNHGMEALRAILKDLSEGVLINDAIAKRTVDINLFEIGFSEFAVDLAQSLAPGVDWSTPTPEEVNPANPLTLGVYLKKNPNNFWSRKSYTVYLLENKMWDNALASAESLIALYPAYVGSENGYELKARAYRGMEDLKKEAEVLEVLAEKSSEAYSTFTRLLSVNFERQDWPEVKKNADRVMAINPFLKDLHYCAGCAHQALAEEKKAVNSFEKTLALNPPNPSEVRYRLAQLLQKEDQEKGKRYLLDALADSPRYREAHELLLDFEKVDSAKEAIPIHTPPGALKGKKKVVPLPSSPPAKPAPAKPATPTKAPAPTPKGE